MIVKGSVRNIRNTAFFCTIGVVCFFVMWYNDKGCQIGFVFFLTSLFIENLIKKG